MEPKPQHKHSKPSPTATLIADHRATSAALSDFRFLKDAILLQRVGSQFSRLERDMRRLNAEHRALSSAFGTSSALRHLQAVMKPPTLHPALTALGDSARLASELSNAFKAIPSGGLLGLQDAIRGQLQSLAIPKMPAASYLVLLCHKRLRWLVMPHQGHHGSWTTRARWQRQRWVASVAGSCRSGRWSRPPRPETLGKASGAQEGKSRWGGKPRPFRGQKGVGRQA